MGAAEALDVCIEVVGLQYQTPVGAGASGPQRTTVYP
jgi:hypothetical protein